MIDPAAHPSRRLAAIMFTDLVGYSALAHRDEKLAIELLELHRGWVREILPQHGGIEIETIGDAFLIEFAGAVSAAECAVAIQQRFADHNRDAPADRRMQLRIGIHLGDVEHKDGKVMGDGVNIASRIHGMAEPGGICVSESVCQATRSSGEFAFKSLGKPALKNIAAPPMLYRLVSDRLPDVERTPRRRGIAWLGAAVLMSLGIATTIFVRTSRPAAVDGVLVANPLAILPCDNLSGQPDLDLLADGIAEEISSRLSRIPDLAIIGRASVRALKASLKDALAIGEHVGAGAVLTCSLRRTADGLRLNAQLIRIPGGVEAWSAVLERDPREPNDAVDQIALAVADAALPQLVGSDRARLLRHNTNSADALDAYLLGLKSIDAFTEASLTEAIRHLERAIEVDPRFALAHVALAHAHSHLAVFRPELTKREVQKVLELANKAAVLDPSLPEARALIGYVKHNYFLDWKGGRGELEQALRLGPNSVYVNWAATDYFRAVGPFARAVQHGEIVARLDPLSQASRNTLVAALTADRQYERCVEEATGLLDSGPGNWFTRLQRAGCLIGLGRHEEGVAAMREVLASMGPVPPFVRCLFAYALAVSGRADEARSILAQVRQLSVENGYVPVYLIYAGLGDRKAALAELERAFEHGDWFAYAYYHRPCFDFLRADPGFIALGRKYGLKPDGTLLDPGA